MLLSHVLASYDTILLDQIAADKIDETINLRLPQPIIIQEIVSALSSQSYISNKILYSKPPSFAMLNLILQSEGYMIEVEGFREKVLGYIHELSARASTSNNNEKNTTLYTKILKKAWESDGQIDKSEAYILDIIRHELGIWDREHFTLMHDESIIQLWDIEQEYYLARNHLLATGIILTHENKYLIADEVAVQVRKAFGIDIMDDSYRRLLNTLTREDLVLALSHYQLNVSGVKDAMIDRLLNSLVPPADILGLFHLEHLKDLCRNAGITVSGAKHNVIANIIHYYDEDRDLIQPEDEEESVVLPEPEPREMDAEIFCRILLNLTLQQLYDILYQNRLMTSGSKEEKVKRILECTLAERSILNFLRKEDLVQLCRKFSLTLSGSKQEVIDRLMDYHPDMAIIENASLHQQSADGERTTPVVEAKTAPHVLLEVPALPAGVEDIRGRFPDLQPDELIIMAILKEAKSLTEQDLSRIANKYQLNWFLLKANMAELIAKLKRAHKPVIQIKSLQNANIYQWSGNDSTDEQVIEKKSARDIIDALRHGVVPRNNLDLLMVGQETARKHLAEMLLELSPHKSHFKFIRGQYGSGKTFLCSWLKEFALAHEFAVSFLNISHDQPLSDLPIFFSGVINGLRTPEKTDSSALVDVLESWLLDIHNRILRIDGQHTPTQQINKTVERAIEMALANLNGIEPGFSQALRAFYEGKVKGDIELVSNAVAWITGSRSLSSQALRDIGVKGYLEPNTVFPRMRALLEIINGARYKGLLLLVDELELVRKFPHARQREQALETLRLLIDEAGKNALPGCLVIFTGTNEFFEDERYGLRSYEALAERVMTPFTHESFVSMRQPIISLESLDQERLTHVLFKIRDLYGTAYNWDAPRYADDQSIQKLISEWTVFAEENIDRKPRPVLREFIQMLDLCEENNGVSLVQFLKSTNLQVSPSSLSSLN
jgi:hypothetical protein